MRRAGLVRSANHPGRSFLGGSSFDFLIVGMRLVFDVGSPGGLPASAGCDPSYPGDRDETSGGWGRSPAGDPPGIPHDFLATPSNAEVIFPQPVSGLIV